MGHLVVVVLVVVVLESTTNIQIRYVIKFLHGLYIFATTLSKWSGGVAKSLNFEFERGALIYSCTTSG